MKAVFDRQIAAVDVYDAIKTVTDSAAATEGGGRRPLIKTFGPRGKNCKYSEIGAKNSHFKPYVNAEILQSYCLIQHLTKCAFPRAY